MDRDKPCPYAFPYLIPRLSPLHEIQRGIKGERGRKDLLVLFGSLFSLIERGLISSKKTEKFVLHMPNLSQ